MFSLNLAKIILQDDENDIKTLPALKNSHLFFFVLHFILRNLSMMSHDNWATFEYHWRNWLWQWVIGFIIFRIQNNPPPVRRSSRLFGSNNSSSVKVSCMYIMCNYKQYWNLAIMLSMTIMFLNLQENNKSQGNKSRFQSTRTLGRKSKTKNTKSQELSIERKPELDVKPVNNTEPPSQTEIFQMQQQSLSESK